MPNRILKESVNESRGLTSCSFFAQDLYKRLIVYADDYGRFNADPQIMLARLYPRELSEVNSDDLIGALIELDGVGKIGFYTSNGRNEVYGAFPNWADHQRVRDSKKKNPEPDDTSVNDWYYRRFIPIDMKVAIIQRDKCKCAICGKQIADGIEAKKLIKMGTGLFHFDHVVPCNQGGRATMENLRLTCAKCNLSRKRSFSFSEILDFAENGENSQKVAESCGEFLPNPIQSNTNPNPNPIRKGVRFTPPTLAEVTEYCSERNNGINAQHFIDYYEARGWELKPGQKVKDWKACIRTWEQRQTTKKVSAQQYSQRDYSNEQDEAMLRMIKGAI